MDSLNWQKWCRQESGMDVDGTAVVVALPNSRKQRVTVNATEHTLELASVVARRDAVSGIEDVELRAWRRNRSANLVGFKLNAKGQLIAEAWVPIPGIQGREFLDRIRTIAAEADLFEFQLTGSDRE